MLLGQQGVQTAVGPCKQVFKSHCAPEPVENLGHAQLTIAELKAKLKGLGQPVSGRKVGGILSPVLQRPFCEAVVHYALRSMTTAACAQRA